MSIIETQTNAAGGQSLFTDVLGVGSARMHPHENKFHVKQGNAPSMADLELAWTSMDMNARWFEKTVKSASLEKQLQGGAHPTQKPVDLMAWSLNFATGAQTVCDPFMGSGTTGVACAMMGKAFTGIERERKYFDIACERIARAQAQGQLLPPAEKPASVQEALL